MVDFGRRLTAVSHHGMEWEAGLDEIPFVMDIKKGSLSKLILTGASLDNGDVKLVVIVI